jgi:hypothetical protein
MRQTVARLDRPTEATCTLAAASDNTVSVTS